MGSIQALRSQALSSRAKEDTNLQVSGYLGSVNKSLGGQITNFIDQLQGVIYERTKAYNQIMSSKVKKSIEGKGGVGEIAIKQSFALTRGAIALIATLVSGDGGLEVAESVAKIAAGWAALKGADATFQSAGYDYERAASLLGLNSEEPEEVQSGGQSIGIRNTGAVGLVNIRDSLMPRYKPNDNTFKLDERGYVGTFRRV